MTEQEAMALTVRLICRGRHLDPSQVSETTELEDELGFDSLDAAQLLAALHQETGRELNVCSISEIKTVSDIVRSLTSYPGPGQQNVS